LYQETLFGFSTSQIGSFFIYIAALLTLWSMAYYLILAMPQIKKNHVIKN